ncbi:MAG: magnesium transporter CorA family protein [Clostridiales bacterium]|nr:magnesium transporter CorA family protein [Clostridiales bacterium]
MLRIFKTQDGVLKRLDDIEENVWINLSNPTPDEIALVARKTGIDTNDMKASLDDEEASRIEVQNHYTLVLIDIVTKENRHGNEAYTTMPLAIIVHEHVIVTVCLEDTAVLKPFMADRVREFSTAKKSRFLYQILYSSTTVYQTCLRSINRKREEIESRLSKNTKNSELIALHELETTLVYFATSLRVNGAVLDKLTRTEKIKTYQEDRDLLDDVIIENKQAIEMSGIYRDIINGTRELFASVIDNTLNTVMKLLASITVVMSIPTIISGLYGMNVLPESMPFATHPYGFGIVCFMTLVICIITYFVLKKKKLL